MANGCGVLLPKALNAKSIEIVAKNKWYGACRFGLADGPGIVQYNDNFFIESRYRLGISLNGPSVSWSRENSGWSRMQMEIYNAPSRGDSISYSNWSDEPDPLTSQGLPSHYRMLDWTVSPTLRFSYSDDLYWCFGKNQVDASTIQKFPAAEQSRVAAGCTDQWAKFRYVKFEKRQTLPDLAKFPDGQVFHVVESRGNLCASMQDCAAAWRAAIAMQSQDLDRAKAELNEAKNGYIADLEARMGLLQAAYDARLRRLATRGHAPSKSPRRGAR